MPPFKKKPPKKRQPVDQTEETSQSDTQAAGKTDTPKDKSKGKTSAKQVVPGKPSSEEKTAGASPQIQGASPYATPVDEKGLTSKPELADKPESGEIAVADTRRAVPFGVAMVPWNPDELVRRKGGLSIYDQMRLDEQVKACLTLKKCAIVGPGWSLEPADPKDEGSKEKAKLYTADLLAMEGTVEGWLFELLTCFEFGFSAGELVWDLGKRITPIALKPRAPHNLDFKVDAFGNLQALQQQNRMGDYVDLPPEKFVILSHRREFGNWYGQSDLREAYASWWSKRCVQSWWNVFLEKLADPPLVGKHPLTAGKAQIAQVMNIMERMQARTALTLPEGFELDLLETSQDPRVMFESAINRHDQAIARALLVPDKLGLSPGQGGGSYAMSRTQLGAFFFVLEMLVKWLEQEIQTQLIDRMVAYNEGPDAEKPKFTLMPLSEENKEAIVQLWNQAIQAGAVLSDLEDENHVRSLLGFPRKDEREEQIKDLLVKKQLTVMPGLPPGVPPELAALLGGGMSPEQKGIEGGQKGGMNPEGSLAGIKPEGFGRPGRGPSSGVTPQLKTTMAEDRPLTEPEIRADMDEKHRTLEKHVSPVATALQAAATQIRGLLAEQIRKGIEPEQLAVSPLIAQRVQHRLSETLVRAFKSGEYDAERELARARIQMRELRGTTALDAAMHAETKKIFAAALKDLSEDDEDEKKSPPWLDKKDEGDVAADDESSSMPVPDEEQLGPNGEPVEDEPIEIGPDGEPLDEQLGPDGLPTGEEDPEDDITAKILKGLVGLPTVIQRSVMEALAQRLVGMLDTEGGGPPGQPGEEPNPSAPETPGEDNPDENPFTADGEPPPPGEIATDDEPEKEKALPFAEDPVARFLAIDRLDVPAHLLARYDALKLRLREWDESQVTRGKTTPESTPGSFAPGGGGGQSDEEVAHDIQHGIKFTPEEVERFKFKNLPPHTPEETLLPHLGGPHPMDNRYRVWQPTDDPAKLMPMAEQAAKDLLGEFQQIAKDYPGVELAKNADGVPIRVKPETSLAGKVLGKDKRPGLSAVSDVLGGRLWFTKYVDLVKVVAKWRKEGRLVNDDPTWWHPNFWGPEGSGYYADHVQLRMPNGITAEVQLLPKPVGGVQEKAHKPYEVIKGAKRYGRPITPEMYRKANQAARSILEPAWQKALADGWFDTPHPHPLVAGAVGGAISAALRRLGGAHPA